MLYYSILVAHIITGIASYCVIFGTKNFSVSLKLLGTSYALGITLGMTGNVAFSDVVTHALIFTAPYFMIVGIKKMKPTKSEITYPLMSLAMLIVLSIQ